MRLSRQPLGPWHCPAVDLLDGSRYRVMKSAPFFGDRRIGAAFLSRPNTYAGSLVFRELVRHPDGTLSATVPPELPMPAGGG